MSESEEQQELTDVDAKGDNVTLQEKIMTLYNSKEVSEVAVGLWAKLVVEVFIVALPLAILIIPLGFFLAYLNIGPVTYLRVLTVWSGFSITVLGIVWCFIDTDGREIDDEQGNQD